ncbi:MAG: lipid II:glycine glycyltransferase FemX [Thermomicrobiales bacterium]
MTSTSTAANLSDATLGASSAQAWDDRVRLESGHLLQSWRWGEFKRLHGWDTERVLVASSGQLAMAQILFRQAGPFTIGYIPRGPVLPTNGVDTVRDLFLAIDRLCRSRRSLHLIVESDEALPFRGLFSSEGFVRGPQHFQPARTVKVSLAGDEELLGQMHAKTRYNVRLAQRRGVRIERPESLDQGIKLFYDLMRDTSERNSFGIHGITYYADFMRIFGDDALMLLAFVEDQPAAGLIASKFNTEAIYMYGGSSTEHRAHGAAFLLQYEAMRWARDNGCEQYDLWGIPARDPESTAADGDRIAGTRGEDWRGLYRFKVGFGGESIDYPPTLERRYRPFLSFVVRRRYGRHD